MKKRGVVLAMVVATIIFVAIIGFSVQASTNEDSKDLQMLHVIMRHGIRTPADTFPNDPHINDTFYPVGWGQITNEGKVHLYNIGKFLRERYGEFLGTHYSPEEYYAHATDVDRSKVSLQLVNAGLWPPVEEQKWGPLDWQPIPIHSEPLSQDSLLLVRRPCAQYHLERNKIIQTDEIQAKLKTYQQLFKDLTLLTGKKIENVDDVQDVFSTLKAEESFNLTLPEWIKGYYPEQMYEPTVFSYILNAYNDKMNRLKGGVLLKKLLSDWKSKVDGTINPKERKAFLYGGHDSTVVNILSTLKVWDPQLPDYGITILLEFSRDKIANVYGLEIFLRNSTSVPPHQLRIPGCDSFCPLDKLIKLTKNVIPEKWEEECESDDPNYESPVAGKP